ncbi:hypothetical protein BGZ96_009679 [Linnemannia gamsii]|uniref:Uncharacterized protein n=1 Tax=Linnemannia gamsii TaxID=64522 RepID=A0ABQ7KGU3_9FUNG|nr:hypothetical protein BGZ96_009679 [Linnemannia gamsii]
MLPWRPFGMLTFGLTIIFLFVRLHGDGYDSPVLVALCEKKLEQPKPSRTFLEISGGYHDQFWDWPKEQDQDGSIPIHVPLSSASAAASSSHSSSSSAGNGNNDSQRQKEQGQGLKFGVGWNSQWHLGKKKLPADAANGGGEGVLIDRHVDETQETDQKYQGEQGVDQDGYMASDRWIWMTNVWLEDSDSGSGEDIGIMEPIGKLYKGKRSYLRQYRRRLGHVIDSDDTKSWELMYTHRFPGVITHTSLSKRVLPEAATGSEVRSQDSHQQHPTVKSSPSSPPRGREVARLAIVYRVVQEEHITYHTRVYHFGVFQHHTELRVCEPLTTATCHTHAPFLNFDYVLPGSAPIKDFSLEHDMILYSRLFDTHEFRRLNLPYLQEGATTPERPYALIFGTPGPVMANKDKKSLQYRQSFLSKVPSVTGRDPQVLVGQVNVYQYQHLWTYQTSIATETTEAMTGHKRWYSDTEHAYSLKLPYQENDFNDETTNYGVPVQKPYLIKSADGSSFHIPIANMVASFELDRTALAPHQQQREHSENRKGERFGGAQNMDRTSSSPSSSSSSPPPASARPPRVAPGGANYFEPQQQQQQQQHQQHQQYESGYPQHISIGSRFRSKGAPKSRHWIISTIDVGAMDIIDTELGTVNDANDILALKTTLNGIVVFRRGLLAFTKGYEYSSWRLSMIMSDYNTEDGDMKARDVLAMKIVTMPTLTPTPAPVSELEPNVQSEQQGTENAKSDKEKEDLQGESTTAETDKRVTSSGSHNILLIVFGDGRVMGYDLDQTRESSSALLFLQQKFPAVIGMLVVVATFVFNEARYAIAHP